MVVNGVEEARVLANSQVAETLPVTLLYVRGGDKRTTPLDCHIAAIANRYGASVEIVAPEAVCERFPTAAEFAPAVLVLRDGRLVGEAIGEWLPPAELDTVVRCAVEWPA